MYFIAINKSRVNPKIHFLFILPPNVIIFFPHFPQEGFAARFPILRVDIETMKPVMLTMLFPASDLFSYVPLDDIKSIKQRCMTPSYILAHKIS